MILRSGTWIRTKSQGLTIPRFTVNQHRMGARAGFEPAFVRLMRPGWNRTPVTSRSSYRDSNPVLGLERAGAYP